MCRWERGDRARGSAGAGRAVRVRQVDAARAGRRPAGARRRLGRGPARARTCRSATCCCRGARRSRNAAPGTRVRGVARGRGAPLGRGRSSSASAWPSSRSRGPTASRAGCASGWRSARTFLSGRPLLLLDEPFASLDRSHAGHCRSGSPERCATEPRTVVLVTHDVQEAIYLADRVAVMSPRPGRIVAELEVPIRPRPRRATITSPSSPRSRSARWRRSQ